MPLISFQQHDAESVRVAVLNFTLSFQRLQLKGWLYFLFLDPGIFAGDIRD